MTDFWRLKDAEEHLKYLGEEGQQFPIFSYQYSIRGGRKFTALSKDQLWKFYRTLEPRFYYEVIRPSQRCKLYFDLEYESKENEEKNGHEMVKLLINIVNLRLLENFGVTNEASDVLVLESYYETKFSCHLVFLNVAFENNQEVGGFVNELISNLKEDERRSFSIRNRDQEQLFIDASVYKRNQQFRLFMSRKMGKNNPLIISPLSSCKFRVFNKESFLASLITNLSDSVTAIKTHYSNGIGSESGFSSRSHHCGETLVEIDKIIKELISPGGKITGWTYHEKSGTYCYSIEGNRYCRNVSRSHSTSKIYYLFCLQNHVLWQQCFSKACTAFKSDPIPVPDFSWMWTFGEWKMGDALNALIEELDKVDYETTEQHDPRRRDDEDDVRLGPGIQVPNQNEDPVENRENQDGDPPDIRAVMSPIPRSPLLAKYISSSSARRRVEKMTHCNYCNSEHDRASLGPHLHQSNRCLTLYMRRLHVKSVDAVLCLLFECLNCSDRSPKLYYHLESKEECRDWYLNKFGVQCSRQAVEKVRQLKRTGYKSRRSLSRALENENAKRRKLDEMRNQPEETFLNSHLHRCMFANFRTCISCQCHLTAAEEVTVNSDCVKTGFISIENKDYLRRFGKYWICQHCDSDEFEFIDPETPELKMQNIVAGDKIIFLPKRNDAIIAEEEEYEDRQDQNGLPVDDLKKVNLMFPCSIESLKTIEVDNSFKNLSPVQIQHLLYKSSPFTAKSAALLYQHQLLKYKKAKDSGDLFCGKILDNQARTLTGVKVCSQENKVVGSDGWRRSQATELSWKRAQLGSVCLKISVKLPYDEPQTLATQLVQRGQIVTATLMGGETGELDRQYFVHTGHDASSPCIDDCPKMTLSDYLDQDGVILEADIATYISSADQIINSFIQNVLKSPRSAFQAEKFHLNVSYDEDGQVILEGLIWPLCFRELNLVKFDNSINEEEAAKIKSEVLDTIRRQISTSSNIRVIRSQFNLSESEAKSLFSLIEKHQIHLCKLDECDRCQNIPLPSLECKFKKFPESAENIPSCKRFLKVMKNLFDALTVEDIKSKATIEWLQDIWELVESSELVEPNLWRINLDTQDFYFKIDGELSEFLAKYEDEPIAALYQYSVGVGELDQNDEIIMKRLNLLDCFTNSSVPFFLKAANSSIKIDVMTESSTNSKWSINSPDYYSCREAGLNGHIKIHLSEAFSQIESYKLNTRSSDTSEFVYTGSSPSVLLKKVKQLNENCFQADGDGSFYEIKQTAVTRYCQRVNGRSLLLSEVVCHYDFCGKEDSATKYEVFKDKLEKIPTSDILAVVGDEKLPELILCENKDVLQIRRNSKILKYQTHDVDTFDHKFGQVLLFSVVNRFEDLTPVSVEEIFQAIDEATGENMLKTNKRRLYKLLMGRS